LVTVSKLPEIKKIRRLSEQECCSASICQQLAQKQLQASRQNSVHQVLGKFLHVHAEEKRPWYYPE
jgi:hypothetical protein